MKRVLRRSLSNNQPINFCRSTYPMKRVLRRRGDRWSPFFCAPKSIWPVARRKLDQINRIREIGELRVPPGNRLERLRGDRASCPFPKHRNHSLFQFRFTLKKPLLLLGRVPATGHLFHPVDPTASFPDNAGIDPDILIYKAGRFGLTSRLGSW
jgi:hypothetical protein